MQILTILGWALSLGASLYSLVLIARVLLDWLLFLTLNSLLAEFFWSFVTSCIL